jgi:A/G-specific adenine glycosylase
MPTATLGPVSTRVCNCANDLHSCRADLRQAVLAWYGTEHRDFPWRRTRDPYAVLVSEVMLQQTQAARIAEAYPGFMRRYPTAAALAAARTAEVLAAWSGLGYNRRAVALQRAAAEVTRHGWPRDIAGLERLPGVGRYTARALASLAFGQPVGVVDTNVRRWLLRRFGLPHDTRPVALQRLADDLAAPAADPTESARWTHATMEFGARICTSRSPGCADCPIAAGCPSRGTADRVAVPRQAAYRGSSRAYRGTVVRLLAAAAGRRLPQAALKLALDAEAQRIGPALGDDSFAALLSRLESEGIVHLAAGDVRLGPPPAAMGMSGAATIGP